MAEGVCHGRGGMQRVSSVMEVGHAEGLSPSWRGDMQRVSVMEGETRKGSQSVIGGGGMQRVSVCHGGGMQRVSVCHGGGGMQRVSVSSSRKGAKLFASSRPRK